MLCHGITNTVINSVINPFKLTVSVKQVRHWQLESNNAFKTYTRHYGISFEKSIHIPWYMADLMYLPIRKPTKKNLDEAHIFALTDGFPLSPRMELKVLILNRINMLLITIVKQQPACTTHHRAYSEMLKIEAT